MMRFEPLRMAAGFIGMLALLSGFVSCPAPHQAATEKPDDVGVLKQVGTITHPPIREASALVKSRTRSNAYWTLNDSGNAPHLYTIDRSGKLLAEYRVRGAFNIDWEALASDDNGYLYVGDVGNNWFPGGFPVRRVYRVREPDLTRSSDPNSRQAMLDVTVDQVYDYEFPDKPFDVEGIFLRQGELYLISKTKDPPTQLYRLPLDQPGTMVKLVPVCELPHVKTVTDASLSPDGRWLAVASYRYAARFELDPDEPLEALAHKTPQIVHFPHATEIEGCCWDGDQLVLVSEGRQVYTLRFEPIEVKTKDGRRKTKK